MRDPIDPVILQDVLPEDIHQTIYQVTTKVNQSLKDVINQFKGEALKTVEEFRQQRFPEELKAELNHIQENQARELASVSNDIQQIKRKAEEAAKYSKGAEDLRQALLELAGETEAVEKRLKDAQAKVRTFGEKSGGAIAAAAYKAFTGGIV